MTTARPVVGPTCRVELYLHGLAENNIDQLPLKTEHAHPNDGVVCKRAGAPFNNKEHLPYIRGWTNSIF